MRHDAWLSAPYDTDSAPAHPECEHDGCPAAWCVECEYEVDCEARQEQDRKEGPWERGFDR